MAICSVTEEPVVLRWSVPAWTPDAALDPTAVRPERPRKKKAQTKSSGMEMVRCDADTFVVAFVTTEPTATGEILLAARWPPHRLCHHAAA